MAIRKLTERTALSDITLSRNSVRPTLSIDPASGTLDSRVKVRRDSIGAYYGNDGTIAYAGKNEARIEYDPYTGDCLGLLVEPSATNLIACSDFNGPSPFGWSEALATKTWETLSPDGTLNAIKLSEKTLNSTIHYIMMWNYAPTLSTGTYTMSFYVKQAGTRYIMIGLDGSGTGGSVAITSSGDITLDLQTKTVTRGTGTVTFADVNDGWMRVTWTFTVTSSAQCQAFICTANSSTSTVGGGDYYYGVKDRGVYLWGWQIEAGNHATSYITSPSLFQYRDSSATYHDVSGNIRTAAQEEPRYGYGYYRGKWMPMGLIAEAAATNYALYSDQFDNANWVKTSCTVSANATTCPDGSTGADKLVEAAATAEHTLLQSVSLSCNQRMAFSVYVKAAGRNVADLIVDDGSFTNRISASFDLTNLVCTAQSFGTGSGAAASIVSVGNSWYRISLSGTPASSGATTRFVIYSCSAYDGTNGDGTRNYAGDGSSGIYVWGAQLEVGEYTTSYIPTAGSTYTRAADYTESYNGTRDADVHFIGADAVTNAIDPKEGTFLIDFDRRDNSSAKILFRGVNKMSPSTGYLSMELSPGNGEWMVAKSDNTWWVNQKMAEVVANNTRTKMAFSYADNDAAGTATLNASVSLDTTGYMPVIDEINLGCGQSGDYQLDGHIRSFKYYPIALSDKEITTLVAV